MGIKNSKPRVVPDPVAPKKRGNTLLNVVSLIKSIKAGKLVAAISYLRNFQCTAEEGCGLIKFRNDLCYNHYHMRLRTGRTERMKIRHNGELCSDCKEQEATVGRLCNKCYMHQRRIEAAESARKTALKKTKKGKFQQKGDPKKLKKRKGKT